MTIPHAALVQVDRHGGGAIANSRTPIFPRSYEYISTYWPDDSVTGLPEFYCDLDSSHWKIAPTPNATLPLEAVCYMQPQLLDANNQTNCLTNLVPNILLYMSLLEAAPFLKGDERIPTWQAFVDREISTLVPQDLQRILDRAAQRTRP